jgi:hypothetical protein
MDDIPKIPDPFHPRNGFDLFRGGVSESGGFTPGMSVIYCSYYSTGTVVR